MKIYIGTDHRGIETEKIIVDYLKSKNITVVQSNIEHSDTDDYVDFAEEVANRVKNDKESFGMLICGTGIGMSIAANKIKGIRAARCVSKEDAYLTRNDNNANILCLSYKSDVNTLKEIINTFLETPASKEERHVRRVNKIAKLESGE